MSNKTIVIIGAGVGGLSAGIHAAQQGFHTIILEKNPSVGGLCTGWYRQGHYVDGCIHWLTGTNPNRQLNKMWKNVGALTDDTKIILLDRWGTFNYQGQEIVFYRDIQRAEKEWIEIAPEDKRQIKHFFKMIRDFNSVELPLDTPPDLMKPWRLAKVGLDVLRVWPSYLKTMKMTCAQYAKKFKSPVIRWAITNAQPGDGNLFSLLYSYATIADGNGGIPEGGSKPMVERMKNRFIELGGTLLTNMEVKHILTKKGKCIGVICQDDTKYYADYVVSALDPNYSLSRLLLKQYSLPKLDKRFFDMRENPAPSCCVLTFEADNNSIPTPFSFEVEPFYVAGRLISHLTIRNYNYDQKTYVKDGKTLMSVLVDQYSENYGYWNALYKASPVSYEMRKRELAELIMSKIIKQFPFLKDSLKCIDCFTPKTLNRYTNASRGSYMAFLFTHKKGMFRHNGTVPGLKNFYLTGQWMQAPGGLPLAMTSGMFTIQRICKKEKLSYTFVGNKLLSKKNA